MTAKSLLDHLQEAGYMPDGDPLRIGDWYDLVVSGTGAVRAVIGRPGEGDVNIHGFDKFGACEWSARFSPGTPESVIIGTLEAAEWQLAGKRGGPVTPMQAGTIR